MTRATVDEAKAVKVAIPKDSSLYETIHQTVARVPKLKYMDRRVVDDITDALLAAFGVEDQPQIRLLGDPAPFCGPDAELLKAIKDLLEWSPEGAYAEGFGAFAVETEDCRYYFLQKASDNRAEQAAEYDELVRDLPFLSQPITYAVLGGKFDGRSLMGRVENLRAIAGLTTDDD